MKLTDQKPIKIAIIGAGAGGAMTALSLAKLGHDILLLDAHAQVGSEERKEEEKKHSRVSTSWINPGRAGHGFHYVDLTTGKMLMEVTIGVHRKYPKIQVGAAYPESHPLRRGRYFITKDSLFPTAQILKVYSQLQEHYRQLVQKDPKNQVLGHPDDFFRVLSPEEYQKIVDIKKVDVGIETTEQLIRPTLLAQIIFEKIKKEKNITLLTKSKVMQVCYGHDKPFVVVLKDGRLIEVDQVINCTWEGMEAIDQTLGLCDVSAKCTNRLKVLAVVDLPAELREQNSMFFCMGAFCMFSNYGDGTGLMTYAPVTNIANYKGSKIDDIGYKLLSGNASAAEVKQYGEDIIKGVSQWIPAMAKARLITVRFGIVKTYGDVDIFDPQSAVHSRDYFGVDCKQVGYIGNACMKLMNLDENAKLVAELFIQNLYAEEKIRKLAQAVAQQSAVTFPQLLKLCLSHYLRRHYLPKDFQFLAQVEMFQKNFAQQMKNKNSLNMELLSLPKSHSVHFLMLYLLFCKIFPCAIARITSDYCKDFKSLRHFYQRIYVRRSLTQEITPSLGINTKQDRTKKQRSMSLSDSRILLMPKQGRQPAKQNMIRSKSAECIYP